MHAIKMQTEIGREISETGIVPEFVYLGQFWDGDKLYDQREYHLTGGAAIATLRALTIQLGVPLAIENKYIDKSVIDEMHTYGMPQSQETSFLRLGLDHLMELVKNASPSNTTD